ncbi:MAG: hypothetical protein ABFD92_01040 [Planctomycetaceae bacterium]|nr:hypothetical protein [Planctomycetaceae bacterium]
MNASRSIRPVVTLLVLLAVSVPLWAAPPEPAKAPDKVYVPYDKLKGLLDDEGQGVFLPYKDFQRLWQAAQASPAQAAAAPGEYLISTARFSGSVGGELASLKLELTVDILADGWVNVPLGLGEAAIARTAIQGDDKTQPLLRVVNGQYVLLTKGAGRKVVQIDFVRQITTQPGLNILDLALPRAAITTLELTIPEQDMKVDVEPMLAATTSQDSAAGKSVTRLQAFLGAAQRVKLSWKPKTQAAADLQPVIISNQLQHLSVSEALVSYDITFNYEIRRRGVDAFTIELPAGFRVTSVEGANIGKWDVADAPAAGGTAFPGREPQAGKPVPPQGQLLKVKLFSAVTDSYTLVLKMERLLKESQVDLPLTPVLTHEVLRRSGLLAVTHSPRRSVELRDLKNLSRVDTGRLPGNLSTQSGVTAYQFISADYAATLVIGTVEPRVAVFQQWSLAVNDSWQQLQGNINYSIERAGLFRISMTLPEPWEVQSIGPADVVDDHQFSGKGDTRQLNILLKREILGNVSLNLQARRPRAKLDDNVAFALPQPDKTNLRHYAGQFVLYMPAHLGAQVERLDQFQSLPLRQIGQRSAFGMAPQMAFQFGAIAADKPAGAVFKIAVKPSQVSAVVHRLVNIQPGAIVDQAAIAYTVLYSPQDVFYVQAPAELADAGLTLTGENIKETPRVDAPPATGPAQGPAGEVAPATAPASRSGVVYYKVVLQSPVTGTYWLYVNVRRPFKAGEVGSAATVKVEPILAAGRLSDQSGYIAIAKGETLAIGQPASTNLTPGDPTSAVDLPYAPHRAAASLALRYNRPPFELSLPVVTQEEAAVITTMATATIVEQVLGYDGQLNGRVVYLLKTSKGDRLPITLHGAKLRQVLLNGAEAPVEASTAADQRIVRLPPSAGQVTNVVLDIRFGQDNASASKLEVPSLPKEVAFQVTLWRLWIPEQDIVLGNDRAFSPVPGGDHQLSMLGANQPVQVTWALPGQGRVMTFQRQGAPGTLSVTTVGREVFALAVWLVVLAAGAVMLKLRGFTRLVIVLAAIVLLAVINLYWPKFAVRLGWHAFLAALVVAALWAGQWFFAMLRRRAARESSPPPMPAAAGDQPQTPAGKE